MDGLLSLFTYFLMLSVAAERAVELLKNLYLKKRNTNPVVYQVLAGCIGGILCYFSPPPETVVHFEKWIAIISTGLAVSGGSSFWNTTLDTFASISTNLKTGNKSSGCKKCN